MKRLMIFLVVMFWSAWVSVGFTEELSIQEPINQFSYKQSHEQMIYPCVRVNRGGSGTIIYSKPDIVIKSDKDIGGYLDLKYSTYVLTNYHVIADAIKIEEVWDTDLQKEIKKEKRDLVYVEIFQYKNLSVPIGTLRVEANVILYDKTGDMALVKLSTENEIDNVARLLPKDLCDDMRVTMKTIAVGCSLGCPPLPSEGMLTRLNMPINSLMYHMSQSNIIFGNSGGAMYLSQNQKLIGIPSMVPVVGWSSPVTHMGLFIPIDRVYEWLEEEHYDFIYDNTKSEKKCLELRESELEKMKNNNEK